MEQKTAKLSKSFAIKVGGFTVGFVNISTSLPKAEQEAMHEEGVIRAVLAQASLEPIGTPEVNTALQSILTTAAIKSKLASD